MSRRYLIVRTDRLGDVLLTTPVSRAIRQNEPDAHISWLVRSYAAPLLQNNPDVDQIIVDSEGSVRELIERLKREHFDVAIIAFPRWRVTWVLWRAGIPVRIGPASKLYSALFTKRIFQHRSEGKKHEADYNLELLEPLGMPFQRLPTRYEVTSEERAWARHTLEGLRISFRKPLVALHPGSGGSSARWPLTSFMELGDRLQEMDCDVIVTAGPGEVYQSIMIDNMRRIPSFIAAGSITIRQLAALFSGVNLVVTNSTGPLHLAVAVGTPTVSVFSPLPTCHPKRWGPYPSYAEGKNEHAVVLAPDHGLPLAEMSAVSVEDVLKLCQKQLGIISGRPACRQAGSTVDASR